MKNKKVLLVFEGTCAYAPKAFAVQQKLNQGLKLSSLEKKKAQKEISSRAYSPILEITSQKEIQQFDVYYFSQRHFLKAKKRIKKIYQNNPMTQISFLGYSWGCDTIMRCLSFCYKENITVTSVHTIDPIKKGFLFLGFLKSLNSNSSFFKKLPNVEKHINVYQKTDIDSLPIIKLKGNSVKGADININLSINNPKAGHTSHSLFMDFYKKNPLV